MGKKRLALFLFDGSGAVAVHSQLDKKKKPEDVMCIRLVPTRKNGCVLLDVFVVV